ncbi:hypothetical protein B0H14DRAFT_2641999 [Mycena olivaceomarginata]|nr:hypothetical protein B0H14DRAFT_2641999 [Mycena olivaceomarginata]
MSLKSAANAQLQVDPMLVAGVPRENTWTVFPVCHYLPPSTSSNEKLVPDAVIPAIINCMSTGSSASIQDLGSPQYGSRGWRQKTSISDLRMSAGIRALGGGRMIELSAREVRLSLSYVLYKGANPGACAAQLSTWAQPFWLVRVQKYADSDEFLAERARIDPAFCAETKVDPQALADPLGSVELSAAFPLLREANPDPPRKSESPKAKPWLCKAKPNQSQGLTRALAWLKSAKPKLSLLNSTVHDCGEEVTKFHCPEFALALSHNSTRIKTLRTSKYSDLKSLSTLWNQPSPNNH